MHITKLSLEPYKVQLTNSSFREGFLLRLTNESPISATGDIAPLAGRSKESLLDAEVQIQEKINKIFEIDWTLENCLEKLGSLSLFPSTAFALESALFSLLSPLSPFTVPVSAFFSGPAKKIFEEVPLRLEQGFRFAKLKVSQLSFEEAFSLVSSLKDLFRLHIDVNRAWSAKEALSFFSAFPTDAFDYVEEPFQNPKELALFPHPLGIDESFPEKLSLKDLESLPTLKALIYKPTLQGGIAKALSLHKWAQDKNIDLILSSSFESDVGHAHIANLAKRLALSSPLGIGTYFTLKARLCQNPFRVEQGHMQIIHENTSH